jgi:hypothetical protein
VPASRRPRLHSGRCAPSMLSASQACATAAPAPNAAIPHRAPSHASAHTRRGPTRFCRSRRPCVRTRARPRPQALPAIRAIAVRRTRASSPSPAAIVVRAFAAAQSSNWIVASYGDSQDHAADRCMDIYQRHGPALVRKARRLLSNRDDAQDVVQALFTDLHAAQRTDVDLAYLYKAVTHRCLTLLRDQKNRARLLAREEPMLRGVARMRCDDEATSALRNAIASKRISVSAASVARASRACARTQSIFHRCACRLGRASAAIGCR